MNQTFFERAKPHLIAIVIFLVLTMLYFSPLLSGKALQQHDITQWQGMSKEIIDYREKTGQEPLWTNSMFSGMPAYQISVLYPANLLQYINQALWLWLPNPANYLFLCLLGFYLLLISIKTDYRLAIGGAFAYAFSSYFFVIIQAGHNSKAHAIALIPLVIAGILFTYRGRWLTGIALTAFGLALQISANHLQITYYLALGIGLLVLAEAVNAVMKKQIAAFFKSSLLLAVAAFIAVLPNITNLWATYEYGKYSTRGPSELTAKKESTGLDKDYALDWSYGMLETMTLLIPDFAGGSSTRELDMKSETYQALNQNAGDQQARSFIKNAPLYWGDQPSTSGPVYNGAIICFLFVLGMLVLKGPLKWWLATATVLSIVLAWGKNFPAVTDFFFSSVPGYNKFRAVSMTLVLASFTMPFAAMLAVRKLTDGTLTREVILKNLKLAFYITGGLCVLFIAVPGLFCDFKGAADVQLEKYDWLLTALRHDRESALRSDAFRSLFFIAVAFGLIFYWQKNKIKTPVLLSLLAFFILADMWMVDKRYLNDSKFTSKSTVEQPFPKTSADQQILTDTSYYRVINTSVSTFNDAGTSYWHKSIGGYHGAKLKRYQELIEYQIGKGNMNVLNMLNTKYFIIPNQQGGEPMAQMNPGALGNAWFVNDWKVVPDADAEMKEMDSIEFGKTAVIDQRYANEITGLTAGKDSAALIRLNSYAPNKLKYTSRSAKDGLAVFSDIYYPKGWNAYIDGKAAEHIRADYVLRAMKVPAGNHEIEFRFEPAVYYTGEKISLAGSVLVLALGAFAIYRNRKVDEVRKEHS